MYAQDNPNSILIIKGYTLIVFLPRIAWVKIVSEIEIRDNFLQVLEKEYGYTIEQMDFEVHVSDSNTTKIIDLIVYKTSEKITPHIVVEFKKRLIMTVMQSQLEDYILLSKANYGIITDGINKRCLQITESGEFREIYDIPRIDESYLEFPKKERLITSSELESAFWKIADIFRGYEISNSVDEFNKLFLCKLVDERDSNKNANFWITQSELSKSESPSKFTKRLQTLLDKAISDLGSEFSHYTKFRLKSNNLMKAVSILQHYSMTSNPQNTLRSYSFIIQKYLETKKGEFYIPDTLTRLIVELLRPNPDQSFLDARCNAGQLLAEVLNYTQMMWDSDEETDTFPKKFLYGVERNVNLTLLAKIVMMIYGGDITHIFNEEILIPNQEIDAIVRKIGGFDYIGAVPAIGREIRSKNILDNYILSQNITKLGISNLLIERSLSLLNKSGQMAILVPESFMFSRNSKNARNYILDNYILRAIIGIPATLFKPYTSIKTNLLILEKPQKSPEDYEVFIASIEEQDSRTIHSQVQFIADRYHKSTRSEILKSKRMILVDKILLRDESWIVNNLIMMSESKKYRGEKITKFARIFSGLPASSKDYTVSSRDGIPCIRVSDLVNGVISTDNLKFIVKERIHDSKLLEEGDVLVSLTGTIGKIAIVRKSDVGSVASSLVAVIRPNKKSVDSEYLAHLLMTERIQNLLRSFATGATIAHLRISDLRQIQLPIPKKDEQVRLVKQIQELETKLTETQRELKQIREDITQLREGIWNE